MIEQRLALFDHLHLSLADLGIKPAAFQLARLRVDDLLRRGLQRRRLAWTLDGLFRRFFRRFLFLRQFGFVGPGQRRVNELAEALDTQRLGIKLRFRPLVRLLRHNPPPQFALEYKSQNGLANVPVFA